MGYVMMRKFNIICAACFYLFFSIFIHAMQEKINISVKTEPSLLHVEKRETIIRKADIDRQIGSINHLQGTENCLACAISFFNWTQFQTKNPQQASPEFPKRENVVIKKLETGEEYLLLVADKKAHSLAKLLPFDFYIDDELISYLAPKPVFVAVELKNMEDFLNTFSLKYFDKKSSYTTGIIYLEYRDSTWGHFVNFYIYRVANKTYSYIVDAQNGIVKKSKDFITDAMAIYRDTAFVWHEDASIPKVEALRTCWQDHIDDAIDMKVEEQGLAMLDSPAAFPLHAIKKEREEIDIQEKFSAELTHPDRIIEIIDLISDTEFEQPDEPREPMLGVKKEDKEAELKEKKSTKKRKRKNQNSSEEKLPKKKGRVSDKQKNKRKREYKESEKDSPEKKRPKVEKSFKCTVKGCDKAYDTAKKLNRHSISHLSKKPYPCTVVGCTKSFADSDKLKRHMNSHSGIKSFICSHEGCGKAFTTKDNLNIHMRNHAGKFPFACDFDGCGKSFTVKKELTKHSRIHSEQRPYACTFPDCEMTFKQKDKLTRHMLIHNGVKLHACTFEGCNKSFFHAYKLDEHNRIHTGEKPYACTFEGCGRGFTTSSNLASHELIHSGEKPFVCTFNGCKAAFQNSSNLIVHERRHTGEKPYICNHEGCNNAFVSSTDLTKHKKVHTKIPCDG